MPYTFGAGVGDDLSVTGVGSSGGGGWHSFVCGWWYPTTLTATRGYWSFSNTFGAEVDTTTSELRLRSDNTTDGQWTTSGAGITTNKWWFLAFFNSCNNTGPAGAWRVWVGDVDNPPVMLSPTQAVAPVGSFIGSTNRRLGNKGTGSLAFQGTMGWISFLVSGVNNPGMFNIATDGTIDASIEEHVFRRWVEPHYLGVPDTGHMVGNIGTGGLIHCALSNGGFGNQLGSGAAALTDLTVTVSGATYSDLQPPVRPRFNYPNMQELRRR